MRMNELDRILEFAGPASFVLGSLCLILRAILR